jgi:putative ATPase
VTGELFPGASRSKREPEALSEPGRAAPLADRMRPRSAAELVGQRHLLGPGQILERALEGEVSQSLILWGPPGSGKTTLARLIARASGMRFVPFSAVLSGIKEVREVMAEARSELERSGRRTLLFVDEIHRFNKAQQDAFLPYVERGDILLIGATTENPSFELIGALLSRTRTLVLEPLSVEDVASLLRRALEDGERGLGSRIRASDETLRAIAHAADGDARRALNVLETAAALLPEGGEVDARVLEAALQRKTLLYDKAGEEHYNLISALHKSVRNSDADASVYWLARMLRAGEDPRYLARRLVRMAVEDIGLADPFALRVALDAAETWERLGSPEGDLALVQAAVYLARAKKSNALYVAYDAALEDVERTAAEPVPKHLRNAPTRLMKEAGYGKGYRYVHDDPAAREEMECMPPSLAGRRYFEGGGAQGDAGAAEPR